MTRCATEWPLFKLGCDVGFVEEPITYVGVVCQVCPAGQGRTLHEVHRTHPAVGQDTLDPVVRDVSWR